MFLEARTIAEEAGLQMHAGHRLIRKQAAGGPAAEAALPMLPVALGAARRGAPAAAAGATWLLAEPTIERDMGLDVSEHVVTDTINEGHALGLLGGE